MAETSTYMIVIDEARGEYSVYPVTDEVRAMAALAERQTDERQLSYSLRKATNRKVVIAVAAVENPKLKYAVNLLAY